MASAPFSAARAGQHAALVRQVHVAKSWLKLDDDTYRAALAARSGGKVSSTACTVVELKAVLEHFHTAGFPRPGGSAKRVALTAPQRKMWSLWQQLADAGRVRDRSMKGLLAWVKGQTENSVEALAFLTPAQERTLIESLKQWVDRG
ncbi:regulatory protein GemA [uncultured Zoogloea sp.]|uniref:regulatory protein GemA n=1 Tax=uncultured Zoogloea sp. TaxID=160237 RepID=UPI0026262E42|nr:regulatory protein GemA [uncultured Zoogloea sp.]